MDDQSLPASVDVPDLDSLDPSLKAWNLFGQSVPRSEIVFFTQIIIVYIVIITCIFNLSFHNGETELWVALLSSSLGYLLPAPYMKDQR